MIYQTPQYGRLAGVPPQLPCGHAALGQATQTTENQFSTSPLVKLGAFIGALWLVGKVWNPAKRAYR